MTPVATHSFEVGETVVCIEDIRIVCEIEAIEGDTLRMRGGFDLQASEVCYLMEVGL